MSVKNLRVRFTPMVAGLLCSGLLVACGGDESTEDNEDMGRADVLRPPMNSTTGGWEIGVIDTGGVGLHPEAAISNGGTIGVAYYNTSLREDGECEELMGEMGNPVRARWQMKYAQFDGTSAWTPELIGEPLYVGTPPGIDLAFNGETPLVAAMTGDPLPMFLYCGVNNAGLYTRAGAGSWTSEDVAATSADAAFNDPVSDFGDVIGYWPTLAISSTGQMAVAWKDVHGGGLQSDDFRKADFEMAFGAPGGWTANPVDMTRGAGNFADAAFDSAGRIILVQFNQTEAPGFQPGIFAHRSADNGVTWETVQLFSSPTVDGPSITVAPDGTVHVAYYQSQRGYPEVMTLTDDTQFESVSAGWTKQDIGDSRYDEGYGTSIAVADSGTIAVAHRRCNVSTQLGDCNVNDDGLIFTYQNGEVWEREVVTDGDLATCGLQPSLVFDSLNRPVIIYRCEVSNGSTLDVQLQWARRSTPL